MREASLIPERDVMNAFFSPRSVAVAGASKSKLKLGNFTIDNLLRLGYRGRVVPLHPGGGEIMGLKAYTSIEEVEGGIDLAVAVIPREGVYSLLESCGRAGVRGMIVTAAAFADADDAGARMQRELGGLASRLGIRVMGPNSIGTIDTGSGLVTSIITLEAMKPGPVSFVTQTGLFSSSFARWMGSSEALGAAKIACLGNKVDVSELDLLAFLRDDPATEVIALHTEGTADGREFVRLVRDISRRKPVVVLNPGKSEAGRDATLSHTGSMAGSHDVFSGASAQAGAVLVDGFTEMFDCAKALACCPLPRGNGVGVASISGAGCAMTADACVGKGLLLPPLGDGTLRRITSGMPDWASFRNPADIWSVIAAEGNENAYLKLMRAMASQVGIDILIAIYCVAPQFEFDAGAAMSRVREEYPEIPVLAVLLGGTPEDCRRWYDSLQGAGVPAFDSIERAVTGAAALNRYSSWLRSKGAS